VAKRSTELTAKFATKGSCSNEPGNSETGEGCQLVCSAIRLNHGFAASLDHEKFDVYQLELKFLIRVTEFLADIPGPSLRS